MTIRSGTRRPTEAQAESGDGTEVDGETDLGPQHGDQAEADLHAGHEGNGQRRDVKAERQEDDAAQDGRARRREVRLDPLRAPHAEKVAGHDERRIGCRDDGKTDEPLRHGLIITQIGQ